MYKYLTIAITALLALLTGQDKIREKDTITVNQFWNGLLEDETVVYDASNTPSRFTKNSSGYHVECVAIKDYVVYILYDFNSVPDAILASQEIALDWDRQYTDVASQETDIGTISVATGMNDDYTVCYVSGKSIIVGLGTPADSQKIIAEIENIINSADTAYAEDKIQHFAQEE